MILLISVSWVARVFFWGRGEGAGDWGLNSGLKACKAGALPLEPLARSLDILTSYVTLQIVCPTLFYWVLCHLVTDMWAFFTWREFRSTHGKCFLHSLVCLFALLPSVLVVLGTEFRTSHMLGKPAPAEPHSCCSCLARAIMAKRTLCEFLVCLKAQAVLCASQGHVKECKHGFDSVCCLTLSLLTSRLFYQFVSLGRLNFLSLHIPLSLAISLFWNLLYLMQNKHFFLSGTGVWTQDLHLKPLHQPFFMKSFLRQGLVNYLPGLASNWDLPDLCLLSS
jgi:hypothetical protein